MFSVLRWCVVLILSLPAVWAEKHENTCLALVSPAGSEVINRMVTNFSNVLNDAGVCNKLRILPPNRAMLEFNQQAVDGEVARIQFYGNSLDIDTIMVPTPLITYSGYIVSKSPDIQNSADLKGTGKKLAIIRGWLWMEEIARQVAPGVGIERVETMEDLVTFFYQRDPGAVLSPGQALDSFKSDENVINKEIELGLYVWLIRSQEDWVEPIDTVIREYLASGRSFLD